MISQYDAKEKELLQALNADLGLTFAWLEDTLYPSIYLLALKGFIFDLYNDVKQFEEKNGKTEKIEKSLERINQMIELADKLDKIANQNNTAQLLIRHNQLKMNELMKENAILKQEIESTRKAFMESDGRLDYRRG